MRDLVEKDLSYQITGVAFRIHNKFGRFLTEKEYTDALENEFKKESISFKREPTLNNGDGISIGRPDFVVKDRVVVDLKAKKFVTKEDYNQMMKYLTLTGKHLGIIINFRASHLKPKRVLNYKLYSEHSDVN